MKFLKPFITFFESLDFKKKFIVVILAFILPYILPSYFTYQSFILEVKIVQKEKESLKYIYLIKDLIKRVQEHRGMMQGFLSKNSIFKEELAKVKKDIEKTLIKLKKLNERYKSLIDSNIFNEILKIWKKIENSRLSQEESFLLHTKMVSKLLDFEKHITLSFGVMNDKNIDNHYLIVSNFDTLPNIIEYLGVIRGYTVKILSSDGNKDKIKKSIILLSSELNTLSKAINHYIVNHKEAKYLLKEFNILKNGIDSYIEKVEKIIDKKEVIDIKDFFFFATNVIDSCNNFYNILLDRFENDLLKREKDLKNRIFLLSLGLFFVILFASTIFLSFFYSIYASLKKFEEGIKKVAQKDYSVKIDIHTKDEFKKIADSFNELVKNLKKYINYLKWYQIALKSATYIIKIDKNGLIKEANDSFLDISGYELKEIVNRPLIDFLYFDKSFKMVNDLQKDKRLLKKIGGGIVKIKTKNKKELIFKTKIVPLFDERDNIKEFIVVSTNITELVEAKEKIKRMLYYDNLTSLPNRYKLIKDTKSKRVFGIIILNIDDFRAMNDIYGYEGGNIILKELANTLREFEDKEVKAYRMPSDEFAIIFFKKITKERLYEYAQNIIKKIEDSRFDVFGVDISIVVRIGIASVNDEVQHIEEIILDAEAAIKEAKNSYKKIIYFNESNIAKDLYKERLVWIEKIKKAIEDDRIVPYFQPIYNNKTKKVEKYEALMRLIDEDGKVISPFFFLDIAKKGKLYTELTKIMILKTLKIFENKDEEVSINISTQDLQDEYTYNFMIEELEKFSLKKRNLSGIGEEKDLNKGGVVIEITENEEIENYEIITEFNQKVKNLGNKIAIDDFGTGYSNFVYILNMGISYLKIDGSLIKNILTDPKSETLVRAIVYFSKEIGLKTIAEFVSDEKIQKKVEELGIDYSQGYYISEPKPIDRFD